MNELAMQLLMQNMASRFTGKLEVWFSNGQVTGAHNNQHFNGISIAFNNIVLYTEKPVDIPSKKP